MKFGYALLAASLLFLGGFTNSSKLPRESCSSYSQKLNEDGLKGDSFAEIPMEEGSGLSSVVGDIDGDEDLDLVVGAKIPGRNVGRVYGFLNNGGALGDSYKIADLPMSEGSTMALQLVYRNQGFPDLIVGTNTPGENKAGLYFFENRKRRGRFR